MKGINRLISKAAGVMLLLLVLPAAAAMAAAERPFLLDQSYSVTLSADRISVDNAMKRISTQTGIAFSYSAKTGGIILNDVDVRLKNAEVETILSSVLKDTDIDWIVRDNMIGLYSTRSEASSDIPFASAGRQGEDLVPVSGRILDQAGKPVPAAAVYSPKNTAWSALSDDNGRFSLRVPRGERLVVSLLGYQEQELLVRGPMTGLTITLEESVNELDELVFVGYGTMRRSLVTNAVSKMTMDDSKQRPVTSPTDLLNGRVAGVTSFASSGALGAGEKVSIRGASSIQAGNDPLYVVDGVILDATNANAYNFGEAMSPLAVLNTNDIESIEILKDAASAAIYGSRASNGVVVITTKSGREGKGNVRLNLTTGINQFPNIGRVRMSTVEEYLKAYNQGVDNYNAQTGKNQAKLSPDGLTDTDWLSYGVQLGNFTNADISLSGGNKATKYYIGAAANHNKGIIQTNSLDKVNFNSKISHQFNSWIEAGANTTANYMKNHQVPGVSMGSMILGRCMLQRPFDKAYHDDGTYTVGGTSELTYHNPASILNEANAYLESYRFLGSYYVTLKFFQDKLTFKNNLNIDFTQNHDYKNYSSKHPYVKNFNVVDYNKSIRNLTFDSILNYNDKFGDLGLNAMLGHSFQSIYVTTSNMLGKTVPSDSFDVISATASLGDYSGDITEYAMESYFSRLSLNYLGRYIFTATLRADGSSKFAPAFESRWGWFPSVSVGWNVSREPFMESTRNVISDLKLRASYGQTGNQAGIGYYAYQAKMAAGYNYNGASGVAVSDFGNPTLKWEKSGQWDAGFDMSLFKDRFTVIFDAYYKRTSDLLYNKPIQTTSGVSSILSNVGSMENKGVELTLGGNFNLGPVHWTTNLNLAHNTNRILSLIDDEDIIIGSNNNTTYGTRRILREGLPLGTFFLYKHDGLYQSDAEVPEALYKKGYRAGDIKYRDVDGNGNLDDKDCMPMGQVTPKIQGGWSNTFNWGNWDLNLFFTFAYGNQVYAGQAFNYSRISYKANSMAKYSTHYWTEGSSENWYPRPYYNGSLNQLNSDFFLHDASFLRLRNVSLAYNLPSSVAKRIAMKALRIYASVDNAFLLTPYDEGWDPEVNTNNDARYIAVDNFNIPQPRVYTLGFNITF